MTIMDKGLHKLSNTSTCDFDLY